MPIQAKLLSTTQRLGRILKPAGSGGRGGGLLTFSDPNPFSRALDGLHLPSDLFFNPGRKIDPTVAHVGPNQFHVGMLFLELGQQQFRSFPNHDVRCVNLDFQQKSQGIYEDMPLATVCFFAPS